MFVASPGKIASLVFTCLAAALVLTHDGVAQGQGQGYASRDCLPRRQAIGVVKSGKAVPLRQIRGTAEDAARGEMINADLCVRNSALVYVVTVLGSSGKVTFVTLDATNGNVLNVR